mmetsp:Transcript_59909/g.131476  ORF Transcript_59909/g.131476 Transcript_59909/m.131476 type:complete len:457 (-) Transcript_59909:45-1415(-)
MNQPTPSLCSTFRDVEGLSQDLGEGLLFDEVTSDLVLRVQGELLPVHRALLAARSPVFRAMFFGAPMKESGAAEVEVSTFAASTMRLLLRFIYTGSTDDTRLEDMVPLMACADHYGVHALRDSIGDHLQDSISPETACTVLALARTYKQDRINDRYMCFILQHAQRVVKTDGFLHLAVHDLVKVLQADEARIEEIDLFKALVRWYLHWAKEPEVRPDEMQAERLFASIRYGQMTGQQLVTEVKPLAGDIVPSDLYVRALEQVAAPGISQNFPEAYVKQSTRRQPPIGNIMTSDPSFLFVENTSIRKVGSCGWKETAVIDTSTTRTQFKVDSLGDPATGVGLAIFSPERNALRGGSHGFPNPNQWGADCIAGIYGTGVFFGINPPDVHILNWRAGLVIEVMLVRSGAPDNSLHVTFTAQGAEGEEVCAKGVLTEPTVVKLALALYSPDDQVTIESMW